MQESFIMTKKKVKSTRAKGKKRKTPKAPFTQADAQRLGYEHADMLEADGACTGKPNLHATLAKHRNLRRFFRRGQLLQQLERLSPLVKSISHAAIRLKRFGFDFDTGQALRDFLDRDDEAKEVWDTAEANGWIDNQERLLNTAADGNIKAIQLIATWFTGRDRESNEADLDYERLNLNQLAELFGVSRITAGDWYKKQGLMRNGDGTFDLKTAIKWYEEFTLKKAARNKGPVGHNPLQQVKASIQQLEYEQLKGEMVGRGEVLGFQLAQLTSLVTAFGDLPGLANTMYSQPREQIVKRLEDFRDKVMAALQHVPDELKLPPAAMVKLKELHGELRSSN